MNISYDFSLKDLRNEKYQAIFNFFFFFSKTVTMIDNFFLKLQRYFVEKLNTEKNDHHLYCH